MDIKQLYYLCALERERHFGRAAEACCITQPTLSMRIKQLESELGLPLVRRGKQFEGFTPAGERVLDRARILLSHYANLKLDVEARQGSLAGTVRLGLVPLSCMDLSPVLALLRQRYPGVSFELNDMTADAILQGLEKNKRSQSNINSETLSPWGSYATLLLWKNLSEPSHRVPSPVMKQ